MTTCTFLFDIIVTNIKSPSVNTQDLKELLIEVKFNNVSIPITASRINVTDIKPNSETAVTVSPTDLRQTLEECGIPISVMYNGLLLGVGHLRLRKDVIESIKEDMSELIKVDSCTFERDGKVTGALEVLYRLVVKCEKQIVVHNIFKDKSIKAEDILFIVTESQRCPSFSDPCLAAFEDAETPKFGIQNFGGLNVNDPKPSVTFLHNPVGDAACCEIKKMAQDCEETVDLITTFSDQPKALKPPCRNPPNLNSHCSVPSQYQTKESTLLPCFTHIPVPDNGNKNAHDPAQITGTIRRYCPDCQANMTWLPPLAACPKCGVKPMPVVEEPNKQPEADKILIDNLGKSTYISMDVCADFIDKTGMEETVENKEKRCRCTCKFGKLCAYCRVRKMCADIYQTNAKPVPETAEEDKETSADICASTAESNVFRPFLSRVFSELVVLNNIKTIKPTENAEQSIQKSTPEWNKQKEPHINKNSFPVAERRELTRQRIAREAVKKSMRSISPRHGWDWFSSEEINAKKQEKQKWKRNASCPFLTCARRMAKSS
ncbi:uncharacterized protein LOC115764729 isoform X2 [Drosophila novamexicana]|uniref:uncharacterized protein LOC115764729 isoform X2 n=1 Tax=Drosophila novamexicana TaxID=47314 RepID=UPI0011E5E6C6|nr:uncharacterized protein LOC115764729 isoform X2 [Drosophila novamexicana]